MRFFTRLLLLISLALTPFSNWSMANLHGPGCGGALDFSPAIQREVAIFAADKGLLKLEAIADESFNLESQAHHLNTPTKTLADRRQIFEVGKKVKELRSEITLAIKNSGLIWDSLSFIQNHQDWSPELKLLVWRHFAERFQALGTKWQMDEYLGTQGEHIFCGGIGHFVLIDRHGNLFGGQFGGFTLHRLRYSPPGTFDVSRYQASLIPVR